MAIVKVAPISTAGHLHNLVDYVQRDNKTAQKELVSCVGCQRETVYNDFALIRKMHNKQGGLLAHQFIQAFKKSEISAEEAHRLAMEMAERAFPGYQFFLTTHVDRDHIHSHIVLNSVSYVTGGKFHSNKASLATIRDISDQICLENGLSIIEIPSGNLSLDKETYELAKKGQSWKFKLAADIDTVLPVAGSKEGFIAGLEAKGYTVDWQGKNIVVQPKGETKKIRLDTLAKQLGKKYTKHNIEYALGLQIEQDKSPMISTPAPNYSDSEWAKLEREYTAEQRERQVKIDTRAALSAEFKAKNGRSSTTRKANERLLDSLLQDAEVKERFEEIKRQMQQPKQARQTFGNVTYQRLKSVPGEVVTINITEAEREILQGLNIFYSGMVSKDTLQVSFKAFNLERVTEALGHDVKTWEEQRLERKSKKQFNVANEKKEAVHKMICTADELRTFERQGIDFAYSRNGEEYNTLVKISDLQRVCEITNRDFTVEQTKYQADQNKRIYAELKKTAKIENDKVVYLLLDKSQYEAVKESGIKTAAFEKDGRINVAYLRSNDRDVKDIAYQQQQTREQREIDKPQKR